MAKVHWDEWKYHIMVLAFVFLVFFYGIGRIYGFSMLPDEFGYWASAAKVAGYDWSAISSLGSYYSFGYSLILIPILILFPDAVSAYRAAVFVNVWLLLLTFVILQKVLRRLEPQLDNKMKILIAGMTICYPPWLFYMGTTLTEILLVFSFTLICYLMLRYLEDDRIGNLLLLFAATTYLYTVHMRTVGIVAAVILTVLIRALLSGEKTRKKIIRMLVLSAIVVAGIIITSVLKSMTKAGVYTQAQDSLLAVNDYAGQWGKVKSLFTRNGFCELIVSFFGKIFYLGMASFGLFYYGIWYLIQKVLDKKGKKYIRFFSFFSLMAVLGQILVCAVYTKGYGRIDALLYGRYDENILPIVMVSGCVMLYKMKRPGMAVAGAVVSGIPIVMLLQYVIEKYQMTNLHGGYFISGMSYLLSYIEFKPENYFPKAYMFAAVICLILYGIFMMIRKNPANVRMLGAFLGLECLLGISLSEQYTLIYNQTTYANIRLAEQLGEMCEEPERRLVSYGNQGDDVVISTIQFVLRDTGIEIVPEGQTGLLAERDLVLVSGMHGEDVLLDALYEEQEACGSFRLYYNE